MKKLIAIALVLAMAPLASAAYVTVGGIVDGKANVGDTITFTFSSDEAVPAGFSDYKINVSQGAYVADSLVADSTGWMLMSSSVAENGAGFDVLASSMAFPSTPTGDLLSFSFLVTGDLGDVVTISEAAGAWNNNFAGDAFDAVSFEVVPEPMTMALMGLGGLFLRRRRA